MGIANILSLLCGVALFLYGMSIMGDGLKRVAGNKLEVILWRLSSTPLKGVLLGFGVTAAIQSSSATTIMVIGFVNSGMMKGIQSIPIILGANVGTSVTGWLLCLSLLGGGGGWVSLFSTATITAVVAIAGTLLRMVSKSATRKHVGDILLGFAVLMFGMSAMSDAVLPLKESARFRELLLLFYNPILGILVGAAFTAVLQSASAAVGILQALSMTGAITAEAAIPIIMGIAIGASVPVLLGAIGAGPTGRRTALVYWCTCSSMFWAPRSAWSPTLSPTPCSPRASATGPWGRWSWPSSTPASASSPLSSCCPSSTGFGASPTGW